MHGNYIPIVLSLQVRGDVDPKIKMFLSKIHLGKASSARQFHERTQRTLFFYPSPLPESVRRKMAKIFTLYYN